jgi:hypothetical protein
MGHDAVYFGRMFPKFQLNLLLPSTLQFTEMRSDFLLEVNIKIAAFWKVTPCSLVERY